ncbi:MAG: xanthine dehydrogenase FAD-binding subunit XdhB [Deltaproteobacteria bacterium]|nr:xanthine dehydrogenase FAD-binding subunit XdhB [Deltaproteobacteria bacterium]
MFDIKKYKIASSVKEAISLLAKNPNAKLIAGGTDVLIKLRHGKEEFANLVDIHNLTELKFIEKDSDGTIKIGSGMEFANLATNKIILKDVPVLSTASSSVGGPQIRNTATIGGNLCNGAPSADSAASLLVLDAILELEGATGIREISINDFYIGPGKTEIKQTEILKTIKIKKKNYLQFGASYYKYAMRKAMDIATIGCAAALKMNNDKIENLKIAFTVAAPKPKRCKTAEDFAKGKVLSEKLTEKIAELVMEDLSPRDSWRAAKDFRIHIIQTLAKKVIADASKFAV